MVVDANRRLPGFALKELGVMTEEKAGAYGGMGSTVSLFISVAVSMLVSVEMWVQG